MQEVWGSSPHSSTKQRVGQDDRLFVWIQDNQQRRYCIVVHMAQDHFERHSHNAGQAGVLDWNFNIIFDEAAVHRWAEEYSSLLKRPELYEPIPPQWLHSTILRVGRYEDYTQEEMLQVADRVQELVRDVKLSTCQFGTYKNIHGNVTFALTPEEQIEKLYSAVVTALEEVVGPERATKSPYGRFISHTSLAYTGTQDNEAAIDESMHSAGIKSPTFRIRHMPLIKQRPVDGHYEWEIVKDVTLSQDG